MTWNVVLVGFAEKQLRKIRGRDQQRILAALAHMQDDPFRGDIAYLKGQGGTLRRRVGHWRIFFDVYPMEHRVVILAIVRRTSTTY
jgi:mRNA-degrading endonuclease RelE of RelBE toxin-antitoxin system